MHLFVNKMADPDISDYECDADDLFSIIDANHHSTVWLDLQAEFPDFDSEDWEGEETGKDITGTDIESQNQETEAAADDFLPVQIERRLNKLSTLIVHSLTTVPFCLSAYICLFQI